MTTAAAPLPRPVPAVDAWWRRCRRAAPGAAPAVAASLWLWRSRQAYGEARDGSLARPRPAWSRVWGPSRVPQGHDEADARVGDGRAGWRRRAANACPTFVFLCVGLSGGAARRPRGTRRCRAARAQRWCGWSARRAVAAAARPVMEAAPRSKHWKNGEGGGGKGGQRLVPTPHHGRTGAAARCGGRCSEVGAGSSVGILDVLLSFGRRHSFLIGDYLTVRVGLLQLPAAHADDVRSYPEGQHSFKTTWPARETSQYQTEPQPLKLCTVDPQVQVKALSRTSPVEECVAFSSPGAVARVQATGSSRLARACRREPLHNLGGCPA